jgi:hypothetical protein
MGWQRDLVAVYRDLEAVCLTSWNEGTPVSMIEAMAAGRPVIATDVGGVRDVLGRCGATSPSSTCRNAPGPGAGAWRSSANAVSWPTEDSCATAVAALAQVGVKRAAAGVLFLRPAILYWLNKRVPREMLAPLLEAYREGEAAVMRGAEFPIQNLSLERRREIFARLQKAAEVHGIQLDICACKNADLAKGSCNIAGTWPIRAPTARQPLLVG